MRFLSYFDLSVIWVMCLVTLSPFDPPHTRMIRMGTPRRAPAAAPPVFPESWTCFRFSRKRSSSKRRILLAELDSIEVGDEKNRQVLARELLELLVRHRGLAPARTGSYLLVHADDSGVFLVDGALARKAEMAVQPSGDSGRAALSVMAMAIGLFRSFSVLKML